MDWEECIAYCMGVTFYFALCGVGNSFYIILMDRKTLTLNGSARAVLLVFGQRIDCIRPPIMRSYF